MGNELGLLSPVVGIIFNFILLVTYIRITATGKLNWMLFGSILLTIVIFLLDLSLKAFSLPTLSILYSFEVLRNLAWFCLLLNMLGVKADIFTLAQLNSNRNLVTLALIALAVPCFVLIDILFYEELQITNIELITQGTWVFSGFLVMVVIGLALIEQVIRNTRVDHIWHIKFLCLGLGIVFSFDLYVYSDAILLGRINSLFWEMRGFISAISTILIGVSISRTKNKPIQMNVSRKLVFHTGILLVAGVYLLLMAAAGYYIRIFSGEWGNVLQIFFWLISLSLLVVLALSGRLRGYLKFYISRNLFSTKYDYREEWLRISRTLSQTSSDESLPERAIRAIAEIVDSQGGGLWLTTNNQHYDQVAQKEFGWIEHNSLTRESELISFLENQKWIIDIEGEDKNKLNLPTWISAIANPWLIIPLVSDDKLLGFVILKKSRLNTKMNWEDLDLLKTAARQTSSYLGQMIASEALSEARQFTAFNQMSAFVVHDIKTLNSQLSLMVSNSARHKSNPAFIEDMIKTTEHAVNKMNILLQHFKSNSSGESGGLQTIDFVQLVKNVLESKKQTKPVPQLEILNTKEMYITGSPNELFSAIGHIVQNAQDATPDTGEIQLVLSSENSMCILRVLDNGIGMTQDFIKTKLFRPFESTKGLSGMGIGAYQCRETLRGLGGDLKVSSQPDVGTEFVVTIPLS
ncbi:MAG: XrtA/PEP-CTERM system histidine kinase PrsK [Pseudomonadota bacterium]